MNTAEIIEEYYKAMSNKTLEKVEKYLHPDVEFSAPLAKVKGKEAVIENTKTFIAFFKALNIRASFGSSNQAMIVYDVDFPEPFGTLKSSALMSFENGLIRKIELFYDARPFMKS